MAAERVTFWARAWRIRNIFQPKTLPREPKPLSPFFTQVLTPVKVDNTPALKQLEDLAKEQSIVAHVELASLSKPTPKFTKDRIFEFVEAANRPVSVAEIAASMPDIARNGVSSRVSEMRYAGSLKFGPPVPIKGGVTLRYLLADK
jgi:hypothetical protein